MNGKMTERLLAKMQKEYMGFRDKVEQMSGKAAIVYAFEDVSKQDILYAAKEGALDEKQAKALLKLPKPLETCYQYWLKEETDYMETLANSLRKTAERELKHQRKERTERKNGEACR